MPPIPRKEPAVKFTSDTPNPSLMEEGGDDVIIHGQQHVYTDMRGNLWDMRWEGTGENQAWAAYAREDTYGIPQGKKVGFGTDAGMAVLAVEERAESWRKETKTPGLFWLVVMLYLMHADDKRRR